MRILGLAACCSLAACVNLTHPWEKYRDAGRPETTRDSVLPVGEPDVGAEQPPPEIDADQGQPAVDAPYLDATRPEDAGAPDGVLIRDGAGDGAAQGDLRIDGNQDADARDAGADAGSEVRIPDARAPDRPGADRASPPDSTPALPDSAPAVADASTPPDASAPADAPSISVMKLTGTAFGTGPAYSTHPTATYDKAFDGDPTTFFDDSNSSGGYTGIDVGGTAVVRFLRYYPRADFNDRMVGGIFQCSPSSQTDNYVDLFTVTEVPPLAWTTVSLEDAQPCRYFRYLAPSGSYTNVGEIELWTKAESGGSGGTTSDSFGAPWFNLAFYGLATASSEQTSAGKIADNGNDGDISTVFCPVNGSFPVWYRVDLGGVYPIQQTDITFETAPSAYQYQIDVSLDGSQWTTTAAHLSGVTGGRSTVTDDFQAQARYVRVTITGVTNSKWGCLREFMVWSLVDPLSAKQARRTQLRAK